MDGESLCRLPPLSPGQRRNRRIQREVHVQSGCAAWRFGNPPDWTHQGHLSQLFPAVGTLGLRRAAAGGGPWMKNGARFAFHDLAPGEESFRDAVLAGLAPGPQPVSCKIFSCTPRALLVQGNVLPTR